MDTKTQDNVDKTTLLGSAKIPGLLFSLALPAIAAQVISLVYTMVDYIYIGRTDESLLAMAALAVAIPFMTIIVAFTNLLGAGGAPLASIKMGEKNIHGAEKILATAFAMLVLGALVLMLIINLFLDPLLYAFGASDENIHLARGYVRIYSFGILFTQLTIGLNPYINAQGYAKLGMMTVVIGAIINIILDPIFIFVLDMGVQGAAIATVIAQSVSFAWVLYFFFGGKSPLRIRKKNMVWDSAVVLPILSMGSPPFIMYFTESLVQISFNSQLLAYGGSVAVGSMAILLKVYQINSMVFQGLSFGAQPILSFNYGAGNYDRVRATFKLFFATGVAFSFVAIGLIQLFPQTVISIFTDDARTIELGSWALKPFLLGGLTFGVQLSCQYTFLALGRAKTALTLACVRKIVLLVPLIYILPMAFGDSEWAQTVAEPVANLVRHGGKVFTIFLAESVSDITAALCTGSMFYLFYRNYLKKLV